MVERRSGMWAVLFTDLVDSTAQRALLGDAIGNELRREHDAIVERAVAKHDGIVVKSTGDGAMTAFSSALGAVDAAVDIQQAIDRRNAFAEHAMALRIGVSIGEVTFEDEDLFGLGVNEAARLCGVAPANGIVVSGLVRTLAGSQLRHPLRGPTMHDLKGIPEPVEAWDVQWEQPESDGQLPFPEALAVSPSELTGRDAELARLLDAWRAAAGGVTTVALIAGEPGEGKTRLATQLARDAHATGARVLYGRATDGAVIPFQPFAEALRWYVTHDSLPVLGTRQTDLARLVPGVLDGADAAARDVGLDEQHLLFEAVRSWIEAMGRDRPTVMVLDDLHWATRPTIEMLRHLLSSGGVGQVLVVVIYRDTDIDRDTPLQAALPDLHRLPGTATIALRGLDESAVAELVESATGRLDDRSMALARQLHHETDGNPFFIGEVLRNLTERGVLGGDQTADDIAPTLDFDISEGVRQVLAQRLDRLGPDARDVLRWAAVIGQDFSANLLMASHRATDDTVLDVLDRAVASRLLEDVGRGEFRFAHALVRSALLDDMTTARRHDLHRRTAEALTARAGDPAAIAFHWCQSGPLADATAVIETSITAAQQLVNGAALDEAVSLLESALDTTSGHVVDPVALVGLRTALGDARMAAGDIDGARDAFALAAETDGITPAQLARVALSFHGPSRVANRDPREAAIHQAALAVIDADVDPATASRLHADLALAALTREEEQRHATAAFALAARADDLLATHDAHRMRFWTYAAPGSAYVDDVEAMVEAARLIGSTAQLLDDLAVACVAYGQRGDVPGFVACFAEYRTAAERSGSPIRLGFVHLLDARLRLARGDLDGALDAANAAVASSGDETQLLGWAVITGAVCGLREQYGEALDMARTWRSLDVVPDILHYLTGTSLAWRLACAGEVDEAREVLDELARDGFAGLSRMGQWRRVAELAWLSETVAVLGAQAEAHTLIELLRPYEDEHLQVTLAVDEGPTTLALGKLHLVVGDLEAARIAFTDAIDRSRNDGFALHVAKAELGLADTLSRIGGHESEVVDLLDRVERFAEERRIPELLTSVARVRSGSGVSSI